VLLILEWATQESTEASRFQTWGSAPSKTWLTIECMPELSRFFGIIIRMFSEAGMAHHLAHFHAYFQDQAAVFSIRPVELIAGTLPQKQRRLVEAWAELHQAELILDWQLLHAGRAAVPIEPLK
jgi:hypothetical protein